jgi:hypothetical protein
MDTILDLETISVSDRNRDGMRRDIRGQNASEPPGTHAFGDADGYCTRSGTDIDNHHWVAAPLVEPGDRPLDKYFGFGARHKYTPADREGETHEFSRADEVGNGDAARTLFDQLGIGGELGLVDQFREPDEELRAIDVQNMAKQHFGVESRSFGA